MARNTYASNTAVIAVLLCAMLCMFTSVAAVTLEVGGDAGWTLQRYGPLTIRRGDVLEFNYQPAYSVLRVTEADYLSCDTSRPLEEYSTGNDVIRFDTPGTYFYICGTPGYCGAGMKLPVTVAFY